LVVVAPFAPSFPPPPDGRHAVLRPVDQFFSLQEASFAGRA